MTITPHILTKDQRLRRAQRVFQACLAYTVLTTLIWLFLMFTGRDGGLFFGNYRVDLDQLIAFVAQFDVFSNTVEERWCNGNKAIRSIAIADLTYV